MYENAAYDKKKRKEISSMNKSVITLGNLYKLKLFAKNKKRKNDDSLEMEKCY